MASINGLGNTRYSVSDVITVRVCSQGLCLTRAFGMLVLEQLLGVEAVGSRGISGKQAHYYGEGKLGQGTGCST